MKSNDALGFFSLGLAMTLLPILFPGLFPPNASDGSSTSALWLEIMGLLNTLLGGVHLLRAQLLPWVERTLFWKAEAEPESVGMVLRPEVDDYRGAEPKRGQGVAA
jgi:hypothetical protein